MLAAARLDRRAAAAYFADLTMASAIRMNQKLENIAHNKNNIGKDIIIAILFNDSNSYSIFACSARISLS